ncbi:ubiquitin carboxyl-terminal hydrolase 4-like [Diadema setosum]|uniref:ubiquitin carboxyl-terminal hydrolase 4-like n=1 Tax=Diadema setosum TaxID=31175 RepID=UPI003B3B2F5C
MAEGGGTGVPELKQQNRMIRDLLDTPLVKGDTWYLIDSRWYKQWKKYVGYDSWDVYNMGNDASNPGPVDNSGIFVDGQVGTLKEHLIDELDYVLVPTEAWNLLTKWYGVVANQPPMPRKVVEYGMFVKHCKVEVYLMEFKLCEHSEPDKVISQKFSKADTIETIENEMRKLFNIEEEKETRIWNKYMSNTYEQLSKRENTVQDAGLYQGQVLVIEQKNKDGTWPRQPTSNNSTSNSSYKDSSSSTTSNSRYITGSSRSSYSYPSYNNTTSTDYGRSAKPSVKEGLCGLSNLGNTCFMNSALQCMSNVPPLTRYFLCEEYKEELNFENPLGMHGEIAKAYADLIKQIWSGHHTYTVPRNFKMQVGRFAPQFSGYQQHDSQELLAFLCDGLHEDLNRIQKKPYIELKDSDGRPDEVVAEEAWGNHLKRNDSIIVDLFHGQFKSTLVCPECQKVSVTFDPFSFLSLPLPTKKERTMEVFLIRLEPHAKPLQMKVIVPKHGMVSDLCKAISKITGISPDKMAVTDVYNHRFHKVFTPSDRVESITERDDIFVYEVPVNSADDPDTIIIPVYLRERNTKAYSYTSSSYTLFGQPMLIAVPRKHTTYQDLYEIIMKKMSRYVKRPDSDDWWKEDEEGNEVVENGETEMDSDSDSKELYSSGEDSAQNHRDKEDAPTKDKKMSTSKVKPVDHRSLLFRMTLVNSYGSAELARLKDDATPLRFSHRTYIAIDWKEKAKEKFYSESKAEDLETHESVTQRSVSRKQQVDLSECLNLFLTEEILEKEDSWYCPACKKHQQATKKFDLWKLPKVLVIHLKRFSYNRFLRDKLDTMVTFPMENLDMSNFVKCPNSGPYVYDLVAVSNHYGGMGGGHYTAYAQNACTQNWYYFDDSSVSDASRDQVESKAAYVLFYLQKDSIEEFNSSLSQTIARRGKEMEENGEDENEVATDTSERKLRSHTGARSKRHNAGLSDSEEEMETN